MNTLEIKLKELRRLRSIARRQFERLSQSNSNPTVVIRSRIDLPNDTHIVFDANQGRS